MRKMLGIAGTLVLCSAAAWAEDEPDRSKLSFEENVIINTACSMALRHGDASYHSCVSQQIAALQEHPTPDRSSLTPSKARAVERKCSYYRNVGIAEYNDCLKGAIAGPTAERDKGVGDDLAPNFAKLFADGDDANAKPKATAPVENLPSPASTLPKLNEHVEQTRLSPEDLFKKVKPSVFVVVAARSQRDARDREYMQGSAVAISDHLLLTNCHVVKDRGWIKVAQGNSSDLATLVAGDYPSDRCVLKAEKMTLTPVAGVRPIDSLTVGEPAFAVGAPFSLELTLSEGLVSSVRKTASRNLVQTSAPISPGSSGGGLFDSRGNLIGVTTMAFRSTLNAQNLNFAIAAADFWK